MDILHSCCSRSRLLVLWTNYIGLPSLLQFLYKKNISMSVRYPDSSGQQCQAGGQETQQRPKYVEGMKLPWVWDWFGSGKTINRDYCVEIFPKESSAVSKHVF